MADAAPEATRRAALGRLIRSSRRAVAPRLLLRESNRAFARWTARAPCIYRPRLGAESTDEPCSGRHAVGESQAIQLILFLAAVIALMLAFEVAQHRAHRRH